MGMKSEEFESRGFEKKILIFFFQNGSFFLSFHFYIIEIYGHTMLIHIT